MSASVTWSGMAEFRQMLRDMPVHLRDEARVPVDNAANITAGQLIQAYPLGDTGKLRAGVRVRETVTAVGIAEVVESRSAHAHLWEFGTNNRRTRAGWDRGKIRPARDLGHQGLIAIAVRNRRDMNRALLAMLTAEGFDTAGVLGAIG